MNEKFTLQSILLAVTLLLMAACGRQDGETSPREAAALSRPTPAAAGKKLIRYRERGIEPRRAKFARELER